MIGSDSTIFTFISSTPISPARNWVTNCDASAVALLSALVINPTARIGPPPVISRPTMPAVEPRPNWAFSPLSNPAPVSRAHRGACLFRNGLGSDHGFLDPRDIRLRGVGP